MDSRAISRHHRKNRVGERFFFFFAFAKTLITFLKQMIETMRR